MDDPAAGTRTTNRYITILVILGIAVSVAFLFIFLITLPQKPPAVTHETTWTLESYRDSTGILIPVIDGNAITARFGTDGNLSGTTGCNAYSAAYVIYGKKIAVTPPVQTHISCPSPGIMPQETAYLADLSRVAFLQAGGEGMKILDNESRVILTFSQV
ncbi:MAG: META domain-containing protein [Methanoregula sp.]|nr:META domain-containing protein [Methanoregula sp.]